MIHEEMRTVFVGRMLPTPWPVVMWYDIFQGDLVPLHQHRRQLRSPLDGCGQIAPSIFAHFNADG